MQDGPLDQPVLDKTLSALASYLHVAAEIAALELAVCRAVALNALNQACAVEKPDFKALVAQLKLLFGPERRLGETAKKLMEARRVVGWSRRTLPRTCCTRRCVTCCFSAA